MYSSKAIIVFTILMGFACMAVAQTEEESTRIKVFSKDGKEVIIFINDEKIDYTGPDTWVSPARRSSPSYIGEYKVPTVQLKFPGNIIPNKTAKGSVTVTAGEAFIYYVTIVIHWPDGSTGILPLWNANLNSKDKPFFKQTLKFTAKIGSVLFPSMGVIEVKAGSQFNDVTIASTTFVLYQ